MTWELECHNWLALRGFRDGRPPGALLETVRTAKDPAAAIAALELLESYASDLGLPCEATRSVVACLVGIATRCTGEIRSAILGTLEELTCGRGIEEYSPDELAWLVAACRELVYALHAWVEILETGDASDATLAATLLAYAANAVPEVEQRVLTYLRICSRERPALSDYLSALSENFQERKQLLLTRVGSTGFS
ncbi:MAG: hypothetical protein U0271_34060 [Polyangiaceae bacterium]